MVGEAAPVLIAYDGSEVSRAAVRHAAELFAGRPAVLATVWEPGLAAVPVGLPDTIGMGALPPDPETVEALDRLQREHASRVAGEGAELARSARAGRRAASRAGRARRGGNADRYARERGAAVVVVGSHGISGLRSRLLGSVSRKLIQHCDRPVLVVRDDSP